MSATTIPASSRWFSTGLAAACGLLVFAVLIGGGLRAAEMLIALIAGVGLILLAAARPGVALGVILAFVPLQPPLLALLLRLGPPIVLVKDLGYVKDAMVAGICVAVITEQAKHHGITRKLDLLDRAAGAYLGIATLYLFLPFAFSDILGGESWFVRLSAWRLDCLFVILLLAARRLPWQGDTLRRLRYVVGVVAAVMITFSIWESISSHTYDNFLLHTLRLPDYQTSVLDGSPPLNGSYVVHGTVGGKDIVRDGSLLGSPLDLGFLMVIPLALGFERITGSGFKGNAWVVAIGSGAALLLTITRSAILAGVIAVLLAVRLSYQRLSPARLRLLVILIASIALAIPLTSHTTVRDRFATIFNSNDQDNQYHSANSHNGLRVILHKPFGKGLGANPATGYSQNTSNYTDAENSYLQVGTELGDPAMVAFVIMYLALLVELSRRARIRNESGWLSGAMWTAGGGLLVGGFFLQVWTSLPTSLTFWGLAGAALGPAVASAVVDTEDDDLDVDVAPLSSSCITMPSPEISVVIPTYRRPDLVVRCLEALAEQTLDRSRFEIAVVDDASGPETVAALDQMTQRLPNLTWASQATNRGPAAARNRAVNLSSSPTILFLDDDVIAPPNLLETHAAFHRDAAPNTGLMGHLGWHPDLTVTPFMQFLDDAGIQFDFPRMPRGIQPTVWSAFYTCNLSMPRDAFDREGGFNEDFPFPACEDSDLGLRLEQHGFVLHYLPEALAWHGGPVTLDDYRDRMVKTAPSKEFFEQLHPDVFPRHPAPRPSTTHRIASAGKRAILKATAPVAPRVFGYDVRSAHYRSELGHAHGVGLARSEASHTK